MRLDAEADILRRQPGRFPHAVMGREECGGAIVRPRSDMRFERGDCIDSALKPCDALRLGNIAVSPRDA